MTTSANKVVSRKGIVLSQENLERFGIKSESMVPKCFGGFDPNDPVCKDFCFRARRNDLQGAAWKVQNELNERDCAYGGFFYSDFKFLRSCEQERKESETHLAEVKKDIEEGLKRRDEERSTRDYYHLAENSQGIGRIPVGKVRDAQSFRDFTKTNTLYLETKDTRLFLQPYGPAYPKAVGKIEQFHAGGCPPACDSATTFGFVKSISPALPEAHRYHIKVASQTEKDGNLILEAYNYDGESIFGDKMIIEVYGKSAKESIKVDDVGQI